MCIKIILFSQCLHIIVVIFLPCLIFFSSFVSFSLFALLFFMENIFRAINLTLFFSLFLSFSGVAAQSNHELLPAELFLERFSLPRVVRVVQQKVYHEATSSSSNVSAASTPTSNSPMSTMVATNTSTIDANAGNVVATAANVESTNGGELFLLYRYLRNRKIYHGVNAKNGASRKKGVLIPQEFSG